MQTIGKSSELFMQMREEELYRLEHIPDEYTQKEWIVKLKSPKVIGIGKNTEGMVCFINGDSVTDIGVLAKEHNVLDDLQIFFPQKYIFKN